ncbi:V-snare-domain-containing protein [Metschnikowia bicuspidata var. bicuspidata NRRL YB-4993]|uniref:Protein transport protein BOS1 n=1 Tax=Metschnikowia bicuspidata var. bicuspidata NRRL YB-4993 TaxID=869754 RepID=A0A1A0HBS2_9ASCO|nr:V-snare-domain-containing protein [Metschnikowia bicuspidata var. bicuspidata NRRL YB-4993]OBA21338.1 V-snare-domain-containing protein [Metschnikowia bicuspidata var. bicuspidata NRRL YB-4993]
MNSIYNHGVRQTQMVTRDLAAFEKNLSTSPMSLQGTIITSLTAFKKTIKEYGDLMNQNNFTEEKHKIRLEKFRADLEQFQLKFDSLRKQREVLLQAESRQELMGRRTVNSDNPYGQTTDPQSGMAQQAQMGYSEGLYKEKQSLGRGSQQLDMILEMGQSTLGDLVDQNETLKRLGSKFEESLMTLGVSQGTIRRVERRAKQDKWIFWSLVVLFFVLCYFIMKWFH